MDYYAHIEEFLAGKLSEEAALQFQKALSEDEALRYAIDNYTGGERVAEALLELDIMEALEGVRNNPPSENRNRNKTPIWLMVIIGLVACIATYLIITSFLQNQKEKAYFATYEKPIDPDATKSSDPDDLDLLARGKYFFTLNDYEKAETTLLELIESKPSSDTLNLAKFWLGHTYINLRKWDEAEEMGVDL